MFFICMDSFCCCDKGVLIGVYTLSYSLLVVTEWSRGGHGEDRTLAKASFRTDKVLQDAHK